MKKIITIALAVLCVVLAVVAFLVMNKQDNTAPEIIFPAEDMIVMSETTTEDLLSGVRAVDDVDGDVSSTLIVDKVAVSEDQTRVKVTYIAKDNNNNITKVDKRYEYLPDADSVVTTPTPATYRVALVNNLGVENLASNWRLVLTKESFNVIAVGTSSHEKADQTVIYTKTEGVGTELLEYFKGATIVVEDISETVSASIKNADVYVVFGVQHSVPPTV